MVVTSCANSTTTLCFCFSHPIYNHHIIMSTRARIGILLPDDSILSVYHHFDGYPEGLGVTLKEHYNTYEKVAELIDGGNMSNCWSDSKFNVETGELDGINFPDIDPLITAGNMLESGKVLDLKINDDNYILPDD